MPSSRICSITAELLICLVLASACQRWTAGSAPSPTPAVPSIDAAGTARAPIGDEARAFPGAEGFGASTPGGRGGRVLAVTNLNDAGPGSLRAAIETSGPRIVVFRVAGTIQLILPLDIREPYITIAGQTAPGHGITLRDAATAADPLMDIRTHDVIVRYLTLRAGPPAAGDAMNISGLKHSTYNIVVDHNSMSWGVDQVFATWYDVRDVSIQWNIFSEGLKCSNHPEGCHSNGPMLGSYASNEQGDPPGASGISFHHNLAAENGERNPLVKTGGICDVVNNVAYDAFGTFSHVDMDRQLAMIPVNYVGNYFIPGPDTVPGKYGIRAINPGPFGTEIYVEGNIGPHRSEDSLPQIDIVNPDSRQYVTATRHPAASITATSALEAYRSVLANAGANAGLACDGTWFDRQDSIDNRVIHAIRQRTGKVINDPSEVGGWLDIPPATPCADSDADGMPDAWEQRFGLNPSNPADANADANGNGYTNIEEFLNGYRPIP